ncbi:hypothetical protein BDW62DRAFT_201946 [Aspergillus aurantiobrunneus]
MSQKSIYPPAAEVARVLDNVLVDHVLFGKEALRLVGRALPADGNLEKETAIKALADQEFGLCARFDCNYAEHHCGPFSAHLHPFELFSHEVTTLWLLPKSSYLWWLPDFKLGPHLTLSTDPNLPPHVPGGCTGPWEKHIYPVKILNASSFTEAVILLTAWEYGPVHYLNGPYWTMIRSLEDRGRHDPTNVKKELRPLFHPFWEALHDPRSMSWDAVYCALRVNRITESVKEEAPPLSRMEKEQKWDIRTEESNGGASEDEE